MSSRHSVVNSALAASTGSHRRPVSSASLIGLIVLAVAGCEQPKTEYGPTSGRLGRTSLNGFGALREAYAHVGHETHDVYRLSDRTKQNDVIVWLPQNLDAISPEVSDWFDRWLRQGGRTLVYVVPDSGSEADYWVEAGRLAPPPQRLEYRRRAARAINERTTWRLNRGPVASNGWFRLKPLAQRLPVDKLDGPWAGSLPSPAESAPGDPAATATGDSPTGGPPVTAEATAGTLEVAGPAIEFRLEPYEEEANGSGKVTTATAGAVGPTGPGGMNFSATTRSRVSSTPTRFAPLLEQGEGAPVVAQITSDRWPESKVLLVSGGSLLTNFSFTRPFNRALAERIVVASTGADGSPQNAGFLTSNWQGVQVSEVTPGVPKATGMELLTVWPLSLVTMHAVMLGVVACLMLLPIFGRPRKLRHRRQSHFGDHLDAVAALMQRSRGEAFARQRISEYMRRVRGEHGGPWVLPEEISRDTSPRRPQPSTRSHSDSPNG